MKSDKLRADFFTDGELKDLAKIVGFFESEICLEINESKEECCFNRRAIAQLGLIPRRLRRNKKGIPI